MIAANIGRTFLNAYNEKFKTTYSAKEFFVEVYWELFYNHEKYMQWITNSPFVQGIRKGSPPTDDERRQKLQELDCKLSKNEADASIAVGFPASGLEATTSGQITNMNLPLKEEDAYLSWIGSGLGIGVQSGLSMFFDNKQILLDLFEGWQIYRDYLDTTPQLRGNQINTWNGQWLAHRYNTQTYDERHPTASFSPTAPMKDGGMEIKTQSWTKVLLGIALNFPDTSETAYVYSLGQTNITVGFISFELPKIRLPYDLYKQYFKTTDNKELEEVEGLFGTELGFTKACKMGAIGVNALEPKGFKDCLGKGKIPSYTDENKINFNTYLIWILAMLNNEELWDKSLEFARTLVTYKNGAQKARTDRANNVKKLLGSVNKKQFIDGLGELVADCQETDNLNEIAQMINLMPIDNVPYFLTLIRFQYAMENKEN